MPVNENNVSIGTNVKDLTILANEPQPCRTSLPSFRLEPPIQLAFVRPIMRLELSNYPFYVYLKFARRKVG